MISLRCTALNDETLLHMTRKETRYVQRSKRTVMHSNFITFLAAHISLKQCENSDWC